MANLTQSSYYNRNRHSPSLVRARRPYLVKNAVLGTSIFLVSVGVYMYTLRAVGQDEFEDVKVPDAPVTSQQRTAQPAKR